MKSRLVYLPAALLGLALIAVIVRLNMPAPKSNLSFAELPENKAAEATTSTTPTKPTVPDSSAKTLEVTDVKVGTGAEATNGHEATVHYVGTLDDGTKFDSSRDRGTPFTFNLGAGQVIKGWDLGVLGMKVGGVRKLIIPAALGYGDRGAGSIPPGATLHFEVELLGVK